MMKRCRQCFRLRNYSEFNGMEQKICDDCRNIQSKLIKQAHITTKDKRQKMNDEMEKYAFHNSMKVKCISDRIHLYLRYVLDMRFPMFKEYLDKNAVGNEAPTYEECKTRLTETTKKLYEIIRGRPEYTNKAPVQMAAAIFYISAVLQSVSITQKDVGELFDVSEVSIRTNYNYIKRLEKL